MSQLKWLMEKHPWWMPGMLTIHFGGFQREVELQFDSKQLRQMKSPEEAYAFMQRIRETQHLDKYLVYKKCPECGWELPVMDFDTDGSCSFCGERKSREKKEMKSNFEAYLRCASPSKACIECEFIKPCKLLNPKQVFPSKVTP